MRDDLISREYIKAFVCEYEKFNGKETEIVKAIPIQAIDNAPTVDITEEQAIDKLHETGWMQRHDKEMTKRPRKPKRKPKCTNFSNCGDCVHAEFVWEGVTFRGIRCRKGCS